MTKLALLSRKLRFPVASASTTPSKHRDPACRSANCGDRPTSSDRLRPGMAGTGAHQLQPGLSGLWRRRAASPCGCRPQWSVSNAKAHEFEVNGDFVFSMFEAECEAAIGLIRSQQQ